MELLTFEQWENRYTFVEELDTHGHGWEKIKTLDPKNVWTLVDNEGNLTALINGVRYVNRLAYWVSKEQWQIETIVKNN